MYDVAVVGLGPVGAAAALLLAREGLSVLAVEPSPDPYDKPRAFGMDHESLRLMQKIGVAEDFSQFLGAYRPAEYRSASGEVLRRIVPQAEPYPLSWPPYNTFKQPELERLMRGRFSAYPTLEVAFGWRMTALDQDADGATLRIASEEGEERDVRCRYVIGCDGAWSPVREAAGLTLEDLEFDEPWLVIDMLVKEDAKLPDATVQYCDPARPATFVHGPSDMRRWEIMLLPGEDPAEMVREDRVWSLLSRWLSPSEGTIWRVATYRFHALVARKWHVGRVFIAGDAAHQTPPFMAQGLNQGFRDVENLCWKIAQVEKYGADPAILDSYDAERRPNARAVVALTKTFGKLICERDPAAAAERDATLLEEMRTGRGEIVRQDLLPPLAPGRLIQEDQSGRTSVTGTVCPQPMVHTAEGLRRMDDAIPHRFLLLQFGDTTLSEAAQAQAKRLHVTIARVGGNHVADAGVRIDEDKGLLAAWASRHRLTAALVRPDHVIFAVSREDQEPEGMLTALEHALGMDEHTGSAAYRHVDEISPI